MNGCKSLDNHIPILNKELLPAATTKYLNAENDVHSLHLCALRSTFYRALKSGGDDVTVLGK